MKMGVNAAANSSPYPILCRMGVMPHSPGVFCVQSGFR
jgi:hypothetical protein